MARRHLFLGLVATLAMACATNACPPPSAEPSPLTKQAEESRAARWTAEAKATEAAFWETAPSIVLYRIRSRHYKGSWDQIEITRLTPFRTLKGKKTTKALKLKTEQGGTDCSPSTGYSVDADAGDLAIAFFKDQHPATDSILRIYTARNALDQRTIDAFASATQR